MTVASPNILYIDNEEESCLSFKAVFRRRYSIVTTCEPLAVSGIIVQNNINLLMSDFTMPLINGVTLLKYVSSDYPYIKKILVSGSIDEQLKEKMMHSGLVQGWIRKPWTKEKMEQTIKDVFYI